MTILCSHHRIVEKEPSKVNPRWKSCTVFSLLMIVSSCLVITDENGTDPGKNQTDIQYGIDEYWSNWSSGTYCETLQNMPLFQGICCMIWLALFLVHGPGGILPQPWRIVFPSLIFFLGCSIVSLLTASFITQGLTHLCAEFQKVASVQDLGCARLIVYFSLVQDNTTLIQVDKNFFLTLAFSWIWFGATLFGFVIILLRIILMPDFELFRVVISMHGIRKDLPMLPSTESTSCDTSEL